MDTRWVLEGLEHLEEMVVVTDAGIDGTGLRILYVNAAFERVTGWTREEAIGRSPKILQGPETDPAALADIHRALVEGQAIRREIVNYARSGRSYLTRVHIQPMRNEHGGLNGFIALQTDRTEERRRESEAHRLGEWFEGAASSSPDALYILSAVRGADGSIVDFQVEYANHMGGVLMQRAVDDLVGRSMRETLPPSRVEPLMAQCLQVMGTGKPLVEEFEVAEYEPGMRWLRHQIVPLSDGVAVTSANISARMAAQRDLALREEWFRAAAESGHNAIFIIECVHDAAGEVVDFTFAFLNEHAGRFLDMAPSDLVGRSICETFPANLEGGHFERYRRVYLSGVERVEEFEVELPGQGLRWMRQNEVPWSRGVVLCPEDITARRRAETELRQRERMLESFLEHCPGLAWISDDEGNTVAANAEYAALMREYGQHTLPSSLWQMYPKDIADLFLSNSRRVADSGTAERVLEPSPRRDGSMGVYESFKFPLGERDGRRLIGGIAIEISERENERQSSERLAALVRSSGDAIFSLDLSGNIVSWNNGAQKLFGYLATDAIGSHDSMLAPADRRDEAKAMRAKVLAGAPLVRYQTVRQSRSGDPLHVQLSLSPITDRDGLCVGFSEIVTDVGEMQRREKQIRYFAEHDPLTGALNERGLLLALGRRLAGGAGSGLAVLRLAVDRYSEYRDAFGVKQADALRSQLVLRLEQSLADGLHEVAHIGQNQFAVLIACAAHEQGSLEGRMNALVLAMGAPLEVAGVEVDVSVHCGAALFPDHADDAETLLRYADLALAEARRSRDRHPVIYRPVMGEHVAFQVRLQQELSRALARDQLRVVMQPIYDDASPPAVVGLEALARWRHPELGEVSPAQFIPVAEESGLIIEIGAFVLREACRIKADLDRDGHQALFLSVNVSGVQFRRGDLTERVAAALEQAGIPANRLELEITEGVLMEHTLESERQLQALSRLGVGLAVDDFGTGYSSLAYLRRFPVTKLKIDRSFVSGLPGDRGAAEIVRTILALARSLNLEPLAEGVETEGQRQALQAMGCTQYQGFLLSRPLEEGALRSALAAHALDASTAGAG
jgi:PAS domain S-box-containing protein